MSNQLSLILHINEQVIILVFNVISNNLSDVCVKEVQQC